jgi:hypothetical protein
MLASFVGLWTTDWRLSNGRLNPDVRVRRGDDAKSGRRAEPSAKI